MPENVIQALESSNVKNIQCISMDGMADACFNKMGI